MLYNRTKTQISRKLEENMQILVESLGKARKMDI